MNAPARTVGMAVLVLAVVSCSWGGTKCQGRFHVAHPAPILQDITRLSFLYEGKRGASITFSTLESYGRGPGPDRFLLVAHDLATRASTSRIGQYSSEARSYAYSSTLEGFVLGTSIDPQLLSFNPESGSLETIFRGPRSNAFIHALAVHDQYVYTILSSPSPVRRFDGILKVNVISGDSDVLPCPSRNKQGWGGVQTVDPSGRVWFYRAYPYELFWYDNSGCSPRTLPDYAGWSVESWDIWRGQAYFLLSNQQRQLRCIPVDLTTGRPLHRAPTSPEEVLFRTLVRVDLYRQDAPSVSNLYFRPSDSSFYVRDRSSDSFTRLGAYDLGPLDLVGFHFTPQERSLRWLHPKLGETEILGAIGSRVVLWLRGKKTYGLIDVESQSISEYSVGIPNLSPAEITTLAASPDGSVYGGGMLTMGHLFRFDPTARKLELLTGAVPTAEGQINSLIEGLDGRIYGAAYPDSILFRYDPARPWDPGGQPSNNPTNLGPMGHYRQMRAYRGVQALDGTVWYSSVTDYAVPIAHALAKADFGRHELQVKTDLDDGFPKVDDLTVFDNTHLLLLGSRDGAPALFLLDQAAFRIERVVHLRAEGGALLNIDPRQPRGTQVFLAQGRQLYRVTRELGLEPIYHSRKAIVRMVRRGPHQIILIGKTHIDVLNTETGQAETWWDGRDRPGGYVYRHLSWTAAAVLGNRLFTADDEKLYTFEQTEPCGEVIQ